jgi:hypothetical protein
MDTLHAQLGNKTLVAFSALPTDALTKLVGMFGATLVWPATMQEALATISQRSVDGAILDVEADPDSLFEITEFLQARAIPFVFAIHMPTIRPPDFKGYAFPLDTEELRIIADHLFGVQIYH